MVPYGVGKEYCRLLSSCRDVHDEMSRPEGPVEGRRPFGPLTGGRKPPEDRRALSESSTVARNRARSRRGYPGAFTLLEVILAVSLTVGLVLAVLAFYAYATGVRRTLMQDVQLISAERNVMDKITDELRSAIAYPFLNVGMEGQNDQMRFIIASLPGPAAWAVAKPGDQPVQPEQDLEWVGYRLRTYEDDQGVIQIAGLERTSRKTLAAEGADESKVVQASLISPQIKFLRLRYWSGSEWAGSYGGGDLPLAVEVAMGTEPLPQGVSPDDYPYPVFRRVVFVPGSKSSISGTVIRGAAEGGGP